MSTADGGCPKVDRWKRGELQMRGADNGKLLQPYFFYAATEAQIMCETIYKPEIMSSNILEVRMVFSNLAFGA